MMSKTKKMNTYLKYGLILVACAVCGGIIGYHSVAFEGNLLAIAPMAGNVVDFIRRNMFMELDVLLLVEVLFGEIYLNKVKKLSEASLNAEDEEGDRLDYEAEKAGAIGTGVMSFISFLAIVIVATGYSMSYIKEAATEVNGVTLLGGFAAFIIIYVYYGYWGVRLVKFQQKLEPNRKGDPASMKFNEEWVESCDEAEKELIYQCIFKCYNTLGHWIPMLLIITMLAHMIWDTGIMAIAVVGFIQLLQTTSYCKYCVQKKGQKLNI